jgi:crotonyl-CoA carboxylase/reductase
VAKDVYQIGEIPPIGEVPKRMIAQVIRPERFGEPEKAFQIEEIEVPDVGPDDALVCVMAAGVNYNNVWAARGVPVDVTKVHAKFGEPGDHHIGGSDASGIVYKVGERVTNVKVGDRVVIHCGSWDLGGPVVKAGGDPMFDPSFRIWGYETNWVYL